MHKQHNMTQHNTFSLVGRPQGRSQLLLTLYINARAGNAEGGIPGTWKFCGWLMCGDYMIGDRSQLCPRSRPLSWLGRCLSVVVFVKPLGMDY